MIKSRRLQSIALAAACVTALASCNDILAIHEPSGQLLESDAGAIMLRDAGPRVREDAARPAASNGDSNQSEVPSGGNQNQDAGSSQPTGNTSIITSDDVSPYIWANWPMPNPQASGLPNPQGFTTLATGRVADKVTHLEWQQGSDGKARSWDDAVAYCTGLSLNGVDNWRLPSRIELLSLIDFSSGSPSLDAQTFTGVLADSFWSSSAFVGTPKAAWGVNFAFHDGFVFTDEMSKTHQVRCVR